MDGLVGWDEDGWDEGKKGGRCKDGQIQRWTGWLWMDGMKEGKEEDVRTEENRDGLTA